MRKSWLLLWRSIVGGILMMLLVLAPVIYTIRRSSQRDIPLPASSDLARPDTWISFGGDWAASSTEVQNSSQERGAKLMARSGNWADYQIEADLRIAEPYGEAGLIVRSSGEEEGVDAYHGYFAGIRTMDASYEFGRADFGWHSLVHRSLPADADLQGPIHLRLVAVGCRFGLAVSLPNGRTTGYSAGDSDCIRTGRFGLRSYLSSGTWKNLRVSPARIEDILAIERLAAGSATTDLPPAEPFDPPALNQYASSMLAEARKHELRPGVQPIVSFLMSPGSHPNVAIQGVITSTPPLTDIQDDSGALIIPDVDPNTTIKVGDVVEAEGTVVSDRFRSRLDNAKITVLWSDTEVPPLAVTAAQLTSGTYRGRSIELEGILRSATVRPGGYDLVLQDGGLSFRALGSKLFQLNPADLEIGSRLRLRGMATSLSEFTDGVYPFAVITDRVEMVSHPPWWSPKHILLIVMICACLLLFAQFLLHRLQQWNMRSVLKEREQLAFEMHDSLAQSFTGIAYQLQAASSERRGEQMIQTHIRHALEMVDISHREASRAIVALRPQYRDAMGILSALKSSAERLSDGGGLVIATRLNGRMMDLPLEVTDVFFRIGQEAISNAIQHSGCKTLTISLSLSRRDARLFINDDGHGFAEDGTEQGLGIESMRKRAAKINALFNLESKPGEGTTITVTASSLAGRGPLHRLRAKLLGASLSGSLN